MTQGAPGGQSAPLTTQYDSRGAGRTATGESGSAGGGPSPTNPTNQTPWGSTSTSGLGGPGAGGPAWNSTPLGSGYADAPTASVPLVGDPASAPTTSTGGRSGAHSASSRPRGPRRARLQLRHINPWTVLKFSCVLSIALFFVWLIVVGVLYGVLDGAGVINKINDTYTTIQCGNASAPVTAGVVFGGAAIIGVVNIVLFIALSTVGSVVYNLCADLVGGIEITLSER
jgi:Transmembrane domain of unknown function (DUF3566)